MAHTDLVITPVSGKADMKGLSEQALAEHERHRTELGLGMYATGCEFCRYHGAYKDR